MFANTLLRFYLVNVFLYTLFIDSECSLLSRVKNPVEHYPDTTLISDLPKNIYRYEPYRGHKTLWVPTHTSEWSTQTDDRIPTRTHPPTQKPQNYKETPRPVIVTTTKRHFWHNFDNAAEEWPKVILVTSSTTRLTTAKARKKTFPTYFPQIHLLPIDQTETDIIDADNAEGQKYVDGSEKNITNINEKITSTQVEPEIEQVTEDYDELFSATQPVNTTILLHLRKGKGRGKSKQGTTTAATTTEINKGKTVKETTTIKVTTSKTRSTPKIADKKLAEAVVRKCYQCGLNLTDIPVPPTCHQIFDNTKRQYQYLKQRYKVLCKGEVWTKGSKTKRAPEFNVKPRKLYKDGCFKRYLDIGETYDERGCRTMPPQLGKSFASDRFMSLEKAAHSMSEGCVTSPHASLTPFSRGISLYARYHVCVCMSDYCNNAHYSKTSLYLLILNVFTNICFNT
uniref:SFRICE_007922 n=1 Tax=Spodoptera frugiperda TaxID=7108 RepID=A0A2H1VLT1_SPOFR